MRLPRHRTRKRNLSGPAVLWLAGKFARRAGELMPRYPGRQLADEAMRRRPKLKVLFTTGYTRNAIVHQGRLDRGVDMIGKPFTFEELGARIRAILDRD
jgi:hypothetical protein